MASIKKNLNRCHFYLLEYIFYLIRLIITALNSIATTSTAPITV